jgi:hypothetical protein
MKQPTLEAGRRDLREAPLGLKPADEETREYRDKIKSAGFGVVFRSGIDRETTLKILASHAAGESEQFC